MRTLFVLLLIAAAAFAESFGGIGVTIQSSPKGVQIVTVMPGSPASLQGLSAGDQILMVNRVPLEGMPLEEATAMLRGNAGETIQLAVSRAKDGELWVGNLTRANLQVQLLNPQDLQSWYQSSTNLNQEEAAHVASLKAEQGFMLLGLLQYGRLVEEGQKLAPQQISTVYMGTTETPRPTVQPPLNAKISLLGFNRQRLSLQLNLPGTLEVTVFNLQGQMVANWIVPEAEAGPLSLQWKHGAPAQGSYGIQAVQGSAKSTWEVQLR